MKIKRLQKPFQPQPRSIVFIGARGFFYGQSLVVKKMEKSVTTKTTYGLPKKREELIAELQTAFANQNLDEGEYENRLKEALNATCVEDLEVIVFDFPAEIRHRLFPAAPVVPAKSASAPLSHLPAQSPGGTQRVFLGEDKCQVALLNEQPQHFLAIMATQVVDFRQSQVLGPTARLDVECFLGETKLDLRNEDLAGKDLHIWVGGGLGSIKILVPPGGQIRREVQLIGSSFQVKDKRKSWLNRLTGKSNQEAPAFTFNLTIHGIFWLGDIQIVY